MVRYGRIVRTYLDTQGYPVADVSDDVTGTTLRGCAFAMSGGGSGGTSAYFPPSGGDDEGTSQYRDRTRVVYAPVGNGRNAAVILGTLMHPTATKRFVHADGDGGYVSSLDSHPDTFGPQDSFIENGGAYFLVSEAGNIVLSAADGQPIRVQLDGASSSTLRISQGEEAAEKLLLANRTIAYLAEQVTRANDALAEVRQLRLDLVALLNAATILTASGVPALTPQMLQLCMTTWQKVPTLLLDLDAPTDSLVSSLVAISDIAVGDDIAGIDETADA